MKKTSKKLLASAIALGLAATSTIGSTYAWFTINSEATTSEISLTATTETPGLYVRLHKEGDNQENYGTKVVLPSISNTLKAATSDDVGATFKKLAASPVADGAFKYEDVTDSESNNYYIEFTLDFMVSGKANIETKVSLSNTNSGTYKVEDVARLSISTPNLLDSNSGTLASSSSHTGVGKTFALTSVSGRSDAAKGAFEKIYGTIENKEGNSDFTNTKKHWEDSTRPVLGAEGAQGAKSIVVVESGNDTEGCCYYSQTYRLWLEGNDYSCVNQIYGQRFTASLTFTASTTTSTSTGSTSTGSTSAGSTSAVSTSAA